MKSIMSTLLATDDVASKFGCRLKPELRSAIEADLRFPSRAASPLPHADQTTGELPENVVRLEPRDPEQRRSSA